MFKKKFPNFFTASCFAVTAIFTLFGCGSGVDSQAQSSWTHYSGSPEQSKFFPTTEITKENVGQLEVAWMYPSGDDFSYYFNPIVVDTTMYVYGKNFSLIALSVLTGKEIWIHSNLRGIARRGINYWESKDKKDKRLIFTLNNTLQAIDATTGKSILTFGDEGVVDMRVGLDREPSSIRRMQAMMPGVLFEDLIILGSAPGEGYFSAPGHIRAYNVVTGKLAWTFHTIPHPGEFGYETWPKDAYKYVGGVNVWSEITVDQKRGMAFLPIGSPTYDYYGADRIGQNLFGNSLVALDARTGKRKWHYQTVHHDIWDYDLSAAPQLLTINHEGKSKDVVAVATKHGFMFVFDRDNGEPIFPIEEKPFPASEMPGEKAWPTQPIPSLPSFTRHEVTKETLNPFFPEEIKKQWIARLDSAKSGLYVPPSDKYETIMMPGALGGANYGNTGSNPNKGMMYIMTQEYGSTYRLGKVAPPKIELSANEIAKVKSYYNTACMSCHGKNMEGGVGPSLVNAGRSIFYDEFKGIVINGRGRMPGMPHVDEETMKALHRFLGGNARSFNMRNAPTADAKIEGPVVASGGATVKPDSLRVAPMSDYPEDVAYQGDRYTTDYGLDWMGLLSPPWSSLIAYDLNKGEIKWRSPIGLDSLYAKGDKTLGAPSGTLGRGMIVTSTGVVFATAKGGMLYAFDADTGKQLWEVMLSYECVGQPSMYKVNGKEYLVVNATTSFRTDSYNRSNLPGAMPRAYVVYALPDKKK